jgi:hypothetical protein
MLSMMLIVLIIIAVILMVTTIGMINVNVHGGLEEKIEGKTDAHISSIVSGLKE